MLKNFKSLLIRSDFFMDIFKINSINFPRQDVFRKLVQKKSRAGYFNKITFGKSKAGCFS